MTKKAKTPVAEAKTGEVKTPAVEVKTPAAEVKTAKVEKKAAKKTTRKAAPKAAKVKTNIVLQFQGHELGEADFVEEAKKLWAEAGKTEAIKELNLYVKPEDGAVYCVINGETMGKFAL